jgi:plasmid stabilization system protein ParE
MKYSVVIERRADSDLRRYYHLAAKHAPRAAENWLIRFHEKLASLATTAGSFAVVAECRQLQQEFRVTFFGHGIGRYRVYFTIKNDTVHVVRILRGPRRPFRKRDLE